MRYAGFTLIALIALSGSAAAGKGVRRQNTFSIVAYDAKAKEWGVGVASKVLAVGAGTLWARAGAGAVVTQAATNVSYGPSGLELLGEGKSAAQAVKFLTGADADREDRQLGIIDAQGGIAHFTGKNCDSWAGVKQGTNHVCLGNLLASAKVVEAMSAAFEQTTGPLAWRIMAALEAGERAGGDKRGKQSAAILVVSHDGSEETRIDFRVDDHRRPVGELARILALELPRPAKKLE
jgi:uncharacterized Ntn-hydrolase superfamily protein